MSDFRVLEIGLDPGEAEQVTALVNRSFPEHPDIGADRIRENTEVPGGEPGIYVAAKTGSEIIGFNAFIWHRLWLGGKPVLAFQSCWTATSDKHRGKGIFQHLINAGREIARARGAAFIFGFPNPNSRPIFVHKLGFREIPSVFWRMPLLPLASIKWLSPTRPFDQQDTFLQDDPSLVTLKRRTHGDNLIEVKVGESMLWGVRRRTGRSAVPLSVFEIGGICLERPDDLKPLLRKLGWAARGCVAVQFVGVERSCFLELFRHVRLVDPPFIVDDLGMDTRERTFSFFSGIRDYY